MARTLTTARPMRLREKMDHAFVDRMMKASAAQRYRRVRKPHGPRSWSLAHRRRRYFLADSYPSDFRILSWQLGETLHARRKQPARYWPVRSWAPWFAPGRQHPF